MITAHRWGCVISAGVATLVMVLGAACDRAPSQATPTPGLSAPASPPPLIDGKPVGARQSVAAITDRCDRTLQPGADIAVAVRDAQDDAVLCLTDGNYGSVTLAAGRSRYVTLRAVNPYKAVFDQIIIGSSASFLRIELFTIRETLSSAQGDAHDIDVLGNKVKHVEITSIARENDPGPGPRDWIVAYNDIPNGIYLASANPAAPGAPQTNPSSAPWWPISNASIIGNRIGPLQGGEDALRISAWQNLLIQDNEITGVLEDGQHNDCLQSVWGGDRLLYRGNYLHDNNCQGFFIKDGSATNLWLENNLFLRDDAGTRQPTSAQIWNSQRVTLRNNTIWDDSAFVLRWEDGFGLAASDVEVTGNVLQNFATSPVDRAWSAAVQENKNVLARPDGGLPWVRTGTVGRNTLVLPTGDQPAFVDPRRDDYRLTEPVNVNGEAFIPGVTWSPAQKRFGTAAVVGP
jgi:hypothetical protein